MKSEWKKIRRNIYRNIDDPSKFRFFITVNNNRCSKTFLSSSLNKIEQLEDAINDLTKFKKEKIITNNWFNALTDSQKNITLDDYFKKWVKIKKRTWKNQNSKAKESIYKNHISPVLGHLKVTEITPANISDLMDNLSKKGKSEPLGKSLRKEIIVIVEAMYKKLLDDELILKNPVKTVHKVKRSYLEEKTLVSNPAAAFDSVKRAIYTLYGENPRLLSAFLFGVLCGKRVMEVLSLKWRDVDLENRSFVIRKENSKNKIPYEFGIPIELLAALNMIKRGRDKFIFPSRNSKTGHINSLNYHYKKIRQESGVDHYTFHYQRNIYVSYLSARGASDTILSSSLGHKSNEQIKTYETKDQLKNSRVACSIIDASCNR